MDKLNPPNVAPQPPAVVQSSTQQPASSNALTQQQSDRLRKISRMATRLFSAYPKSDYADSDAAHAGIVNVLKAYPLSVVNRLTNETESEALQLKYKFPPRLAEIKQEADAIMGEHARRKAQENRLAEQLAARAEADAPREPRPSIAELKAKYGENYGLDPHGGEQRKSVETFKAPSIEELKTYYGERPDRINQLLGPTGSRT